MKWLHKVLPFDWITQPATERWTRRIPHMERQHDTGTIHIGGPGRTSMRDVFEGERN